MSGYAVRPPVNMITYSYGSRMVFVAPAESYDKAVDLAQESFPELRDVDRDQICLETRVIVGQSERKQAQIGRTAWPAFLAMLVQFEIVDGVGM
ncbi:hypothetical protein BGW80DRAFT_1306130 [Lactifluus volemus]|nr:hypothetical protein BGW80DRAFT_1306130 [Lactifluus volemus]